MLQELHSKSCLRITTTMQDCKNIALWNQEHRLYKRLRELHKIANADYQTFQKAIENENVEICVNCMIDMIKVTNYLLDKQIAFLEKDFIEHGGIRERMTRARLDYREKR